MKRSLLALSTIISLTQVAFSATWLVGPTQTYTTPNALYLADGSSITINNGDTILIDSADYSGNDALAAWQQDDLFIQGVNGRPRLIAAGSYILGKGIWVCVGDNQTVDNFEFQDAAVPSMNGAGIRLDGVGLTVRNCYFHDNENGILTSNPYDGDILIEYTEFEANGYGDGFTHNMYIGHVNSFTIQYCYTHHTDVGHNIKSRADVNYILYNRIMDEETGNSSRLIDVPNGGYCLIKGNVMMQGENAPNNNCIGYGKEGLSNTPPHDLYVVNNTIVNKRVASCNYVDVQSGTDVAYIVNNIFAGDGNELVGSATTFTNNYYTDDIASMMFVDEANYDYHILAFSPAVDSGETQTAPLIAEYEYVLDVNFTARNPYGSSVDVGAYEFWIDETGIEENVDKAIRLYPNPTTDKLQVSVQNLNGSNELIVLDLRGKVLHKESFVGSQQLIDVSSLSNGTYLLVIHSEGMKLTERFQKK